MIELHTPEQIVKILWRDIVKRGNGIVWIGSGLSFDIYPGWIETIRLLGKNCGVAIPEEWADVSPSPTDLLSKADDCKRRSPTQYEATLSILFGEEPIKDRREYRHLLATPQYRAFITTNFDRLLYENANDIGSNRLIQAYPILDAGHLGSDGQPCFYIHGLAYKNNAPCGKDLVFAQSEFDKAYNTIDGSIGITSIFILTILTHYPILFVGCNLKEPYIRNCFDLIHTIHKQHEDLDKPLRYTVRPGRNLTNLKDEERNRILEDQIDEERRFREVGIEVLRYEAHERDEFQFQTTILKLLKEKGIAEKRKIPPLHSQEAPSQ